MERVFNSFDAAIHAGLLCILKMPFNERLCVSFDYGNFLDGNWDCFAIKTDDSLEFTNEGMYLNGRYFEYSKMSNMNICTYVSEGKNLALADADIMTMIIRK